MAQPARPYHHGDLRRVLVSTAVEVVGETGAAALSLREVARRAGVSHAAPSHHFGDKAGLLTAVAAEGYRLLAATLTEAMATTGSFQEVGVAYVRFAVSHRAHFEVMFRPELYHEHDAELVEARASAGELLFRPAADAAHVGDARQVEAGLAAWSLVHGVATLWLSGNLPAAAGDDPEAIARAVTAYLFR